MSAIEVTRPARGLVLAFAAGVVVFAAVAALSVWAITTVVTGEDRASPEAVDAAVTQYAARPAGRALQPGRAVGWDRCAIVDLADDRGVSLVSVAMLRQGESWRMARVETDEAPFEPSDAAGTEEGCLRVARAQGGG